MATGLTQEAPTCDTCSQPASHWCDTCSTVLCTLHKGEHPRTHDVVCLDQDEYDDNDDDEVAPGQEDNDTVLNLATGRARRPEKKIIVSEEKMSDVLSMFESSSPVAICSKLVCFPPEDEVQHSAPEHGGHHDKIAPVFASLRQKCFAVLPNFFDFGKEGVRSKIIAAFQSSGQVKKVGVPAAAGAGVAASFNGFQADFSIAEEHLAENADVAPVFAALASYGTRLKKGINLAEQQPETGTGEMMSFVSSGAFSARDAIPCDGRMPIPGRAGRRVSCLLFCKDEKSLAEGDDLAVTLKFKVKEELHDMRLTPADGTLLIFLSGAPQEIVVEKKGDDGAGATVVFAKWWW